MHNENCKSNHFGNSGSMDVSGAIEIFQRSESLHGLRYTKFWGDGDARAYKAGNEMQPYGHTCIEKLECVGYVKKRMGTRLQALKLKIKHKKLSDKKHWMITVDLQTLKLINYSVIMGWQSETIPIVLIVLIQCTNSINSMKRAIWATYFHKHLLMHIDNMVCAQQTKIPCVNITEQLQQVNRECDTLAQVRLTFKQRKRILKWFRKFYNISEVQQRRQQYSCLQKNLKFIEQKGIGTMDDQDGHAHQQAKRFQLEIKIYAHGYHNSQHYNVHVKQA
ncbi:uncharacterized protein TNCV_2836291 [Trichonephila clavipes]|nr:uncharacterized protein TNCV_2836291 [Trichonephila clavipes]